MVSLRSSYSFWVRFSVLDDLGSFPAFLSVESDDPSPYLVGPDGLKVLELHLLCVPRPPYPELAI